MVSITSRCYSLTTLCEGGRRTRWFVVWRAWRLVTNHRASPSPSSSPPSSLYSSSLHWSPVSGVAKRQIRSGMFCVMVGLLWQSSRSNVWLFSWYYDWLDSWLWLCDKPPYFRHTGPPEQVLRGDQTQQWRGAPGLWDSNHHQGKGGRGPSFILPSCNEHWGCEMMLVLWCVITTTFLLR